MRHDELPIDEAVHDPYQVLPTVCVNKRLNQTVVNRAALLVVSILAIIVVVYGGYQLWYLRQVNPPGDAAAAEVFTITETDDLVTVSKRLEQEGFIVNDSVFRSYVSSKGGLDVAAGFYTLKPQDHVGNILRVLRTPPNETLTKITFPEGFTLSQMAERLGEELKSVTESDFLLKTGDTPAEISAVRSVYQFAFPRYLPHQWRPDRNTSSPTNAQAHGTSGTSRRS
jgi:cell division protein YceG involved in septum cleavage